jgi:PsbP-like protein
VEGWTHAAALGNVSYYVILPGTLSGSNCHFALDGQRPALDCLGAAGRNDYFSVKNNDRWYLLKSKWTPSGEYAATVKDRGSTLCLRKAGCYRVLAEVRLVPNELPARFKISVPGSLSLTYSNNDMSFSYPQNWNTEEPKNKDDVLGREVGVAPQEAHLASWLTHGMFVGHISKFSKYPQTLDGAFEQFSALGKQLMAMAITNPKPMQVGGCQGKIAAYTAPSVLTAGESGWVIVIKDNGDGYYWIMMFHPSNDDGHLYAQTFESILNSFKFKK